MSFLHMFEIEGVRGQNRNKEVQWGHTAIALSDLEGLFQCTQFYDSMKPQIICYHLKPQ